MLAKSLIKLIDEAIIPAVILIVAKMVAILMVAYFFKFPFTVAFAKIFYILPAIQFKNLSDYVLAENYSNLAMFLAAAAGTLMVLVKAHVFHISHINPSLHARLLKLNFKTIVTSSYHLYHQATIWLIFLWLTVAFLLVSTFSKVTNPAIVVIAFIVAANFTWILALDIEKEVELNQ